MAFHILVLKMLLSHIWTPSVIFRRRPLWVFLRNYGTVRLGISVSAKNAIFRLNTWISVFCLTFFGDSRNKREIFAKLLKYSVEQHLCFVRTIESNSSGTIFSQMTQSSCSHAYTLARTQTFWIFLHLFLQILSLVWVKITPKSGVLSQIGAPATSWGSDFFVQFRNRYESPRMRRRKRWLQ